MGVKERCKGPNFRNLLGVIPLRIPLPGKFVHKSALSSSACQSRGYAVRKQAVNFRPGYTGAGRSLALVLLSVPDMRRHGGFAGIGAGRLLPGIQTNIATRLPQDFRIRREAPYNAG